MRKFLYILLFLCACKANAQIYYEDFYPESELQNRLGNARSPAEKIYAAGILAIHYKKTFKDSLAAIYVNKLYQIAGQTKNKNLTAKALWWDAYSSSVYTAYDEYELGTAKATNLLHYAEKNNLPVLKIAANVFLCDLNIHNNINLSEHHALAAKEVLENWKADSTKKDSVKLEVYFRLSHVFIHKMDGVNIARYLLALHDYAELRKNEVLKIKATYILARMYNEWGQKEKALLWRKKLCDYYIKTGQRSELLQNLPFLANAYANTGNKERAKYYHQWADKLVDSLGTYTLNTVVLNVHDANKQKLGLITPEQVLRLLNGVFGNRLLLPPALIDKWKALIFLKMDQVDSAGYYLAKAKKDKLDSLGRHFTHDFHLWEGKYHLRKKEYNAAVEAFNMALKVAEQRGNRTLIEEALEGLSEAYEGKKDYKTSNQYLSQYYQFKDSLNSLNRKEEVTLMEMQKQKELQNAAFREQQRAQQEEQNRIAYKNKVRLYALLMGVVLLLLMAGILYRNNLQKQKANVMLQQQKDKIEDTLSKLKSTQAQLLQAEKMASLGELTAGIAHEIQNPLNFVNNFSEVNKELISEMKEELKSGNSGEVIAIAEAIEQNLEKINNHGKRADSIVKGMLQHSRASGGEKQQTDINALADEYLRLTYHGLRAKDKSFNANLVTEFDPNIGKIEVVPQELGRVLLNLYNNAFYAAQQKKAQLNGQYQPEVKVTTKRIDGKVEIIVRDNGSGIPEKVRNKIFQPFFTTKPTGQGTGLGLSLSYDIITKSHGGELKVESQEGEYSEFIILFPMTDKYSTRE